MHQDRQRLSGRAALLAAAIAMLAVPAAAQSVQTQGLGDLYRIYLTTQQDGVDFNLAFIGHDFGVKYTEQFDPPYMRALFDYGYELGAQGYSWQKVPPGVSPSVGASRTAPRAPVPRAASSRSPDG